MRKSQCASARNRLRALLEKCEEIADDLEAKADNYEAATETIGDAAQARLDQYREALDYLRNGMIQDAIDSIEAIEDLDP